MNRGALIAFEGLDGCGKTTQVELLARALRELGRQVCVTREPTDGTHGRRIRAMARSGEAVSPEEELRWFVEDRREHVAEVICPSLEAGQWVLTDRYYLSTVAYQGARGIDPEGILAESEAEFPIPDLVLLLEIDVEAGLERVRSRGAAVEAVFEQRDLLERAAKIFADLGCSYLARIDARRPPEAVKREILAVVEERLPGD